MYRFTIRDVLWLTLVAAVAVGWRLEHRRIGQANESLLLDNMAKAQALETMTQKFAATSKKEQSLQREVELVGQLARNRELELKKREAELRDSLARREAVLDALRNIQGAPPSNGNSPVPPLAQP